MTHPGIDQRTINKAQAYWYARGFIAGNPPLGGLLLMHLEDELPLGADLADNGVAADVVASIFADAFACCPHGDIQLGFVEWTAHALPLEAPTLHHQSEPVHR